jgi:hypothetical protein
MICRSKRTGNKVIQEVVRYLGVAHSNEQRDALVRLAEKEIKAADLPLESSSKEKKQSGALLQNMTETARSIDGMHDIFGAMLNKTQIASLMKSYEYNRLKDVVISRIANPHSKLHTAEILSKDYLKPILTKSH